jgi:hypothetical protein
MDTRGNSLDVVAEKLVDEILSTPYLNREELVPKCRAIIALWIRVNDRPVDYNKVTSKYGNVKKAAVRNDFEKMFWRMKFAGVVGHDNMQAYYDELDRDIEECGYKRRKDAPQDACSR